jgi:ribosome-associated toxin RatA of RatAB toxin-antitoxin module
MMFRLIIWLGLFAAITPNGWASRANDVDPSTLKKLVGSGQIVMIDEHADGRLKLVTGATHVKSTPPEVWKIITDYGAYPEWMPQTSKVTVSNQNGASRDVHYRLDFEFSVITKRVEYTVRHRWTDNRRIDWTLVDGDFKTAVGSWELVPTDDGAGTLVFFSTYTDLDSMGWIVKTLLKEQPTMDIAIQGSTALMAVKAVKERAESR